MDQTERIYSQEAANVLKQYEHNLFGDVAALEKEFETALREVARGPQAYGAPLKWVEQIIREAKVSDHSPVSGGNGTG